MDCSSSPKKKKMRISETCHDLKRTIKSENTSNKRLKSVNNGDNAEKEIKAMKRKNFVIACEKVSYEAYFDHCTRFLLMYVPRCANGKACKHLEFKNNIKEMSSCAEESFKIEMKANMWCEALEVCQMSITSTQCLSATVLRDIVEIILNAHEDYDADYTVTYLIDRCQEILSQNFSTHPPCHIKSLRKCYNNFLTLPMDLKDNTFTNRDQFGCDKGVVKYCMNRLEYEISSESKDEALVDKYENIPEEMKQSVKGLHWQKEKFEIFELLERPERIKRLMAVLESIIELLQFDLAIWCSRYTHNVGSHIMKSHKPLMAYILWSNNVLYTGAVNNNCRQILKLFVYSVYLHYPEKHINIMTTWLNTIIQTFYICETSSNNDFPNIGKYCTTFAKEFYKIISELPQESIIRILERIQPSFMQHLIGVIHLHSLLSTQEDNILKILIRFVKDFQWNMFVNDNSEIHLLKRPIKPKKVKRILNRISKQFNTSKTIDSLCNIDNIEYPKFEFHSSKSDSEITRNHVIHSLYITLEAYLDAYNIQHFQETLDILNEQLIEDGCVRIETNTTEECTSYCVTENFIKKYRSLFQLLKELTLLLHDVKNNGELPESMEIFKHIGIKL